MKKTRRSRQRFSHPFICDTHIDTLSKMLQFGWTSLNEIPSDSQVTGARLRRSSVGAAVFAIFTEKHDHSLSPPLRTLRMIDMAYSIARENSGWLQMATNARGIKQAQGEGKTAMILAIENGIAIGCDLGHLRNYYRLGVRLMSLTWNHRNRLGDGIGTLNGRRGLTPFGRDTLREMQRLGMIIDVSHLSERTFWHVVEATEGPLAATHSNALSICKSPRNLSNDQIRAISDRGGFIGLNFCGYFLNDSGEASIDDVVKHASHIAELAGTRVLAIGSDFDGTASLPRGLEHVGKIGGLIESLRQAGFSRSDIDAISHRNFLRVFSGVCG